MKEKLINKIKRKSFCKIFQKLIIAVGLIISLPFLIKADIVYFDSIPKKFSHFESLSNVNKIFNEVSLSNFSNKLNNNNNNSSLTLIKVLHIGDSHVKSGFFAEKIIDKLNAYYAGYLKKNIFFNGVVFSKNGTKYSDYSDLSELDNHLIEDKPDLVIISLGTNDAFSGSANSRFYEKIDHLVSKIKALSSNSALLLTTPPVALKKNVQTSNFEVFSEIKYITGTIIKYANNHQIAYWDLYSQTSGRYSMNTWILNKLVAPDRIHFTAKGYDLIAQMLFEALKNCL